jgi:hypothetical protein
MWQEGSQDLAIAHRSFRLRTLQRLAQRAESMGNIALTARLLEQAAKEVGDAFTSRRLSELTGAGGGPIETREVPALDHLT